MPTLQTCRRWNSASPIDSVEGEVSVSAIFRSSIDADGGHVITTCCAVIPINPLLSYTLFRKPGAELTEHAEDAKDDYIFGCTNRLGTWM